MQANGMFHSIELNTNGILTRSLTAGTPQDPSRFRWRPPHSAFSKLAEAYRNTWLKHLGLCLVIVRKLRTACRIIHHTHYRSSDEHKASTRKISREPTRQGLSLMIMTTQVVSEAYSTGAVSIIKSVRYFGRHIISICQTCFDLACIGARPRGFW